jgi:hypothetical protein
LDHPQPQHECSDHQPGYFLVKILDQLPTVKVSYDAHASGLGPASAAIYVFFITDGVGITELEASIDALTTALKSDFALLEKLAQQQRG